MVVIVRLKKRGNTINRFTGQKQKLMVVNIHHIHPILYPKQVLEYKGFVSEGDLYNQPQGRSNT